MKWENLFISYFIYIPTYINLLLYSLSNFKCIDVQNIKTYSHSIIKVTHVVINVVNIYIDIPIDDYIFVFLIFYFQNNNNKKSTDAKF